MVIYVVFHNPEALLAETLLVDPEMWLCLVLQYAGEPLPPRFQMSSTKTFVIPGSALPWIKKHLEMGVGVGEKPC